jgi:hypothetical protein
MATKHVFTVASGSFTPSYPINGSQLSIAEFDLANFSSGFISVDVTSITESVVVTLCPVDAVSGNAVFVDNDGNWYPPTGDGAQFTVSSTGLNGSIANLAGSSYQVLLASSSNEASITLSVSLVATI